jgi:predicted transcriptional regulator
MTHTLEITSDLQDRFEQVAAAKGRPVERLMTEALEQFLRRDAVRADAEDAWAEFQATGQHLTGEEVQSWLATWGTDAETPAPDCHG